MTYSMTLLAAAEPSNPSLWSLLEFMLTGILVVFLALWFLSLVCSGFGLLVKFFSAPKESIVPVAAPTEELSEEVLVAIVAAVETVISAPHRILSLKSPGVEGAGWVLQGRMRHHTSHNIDPR